MKKLLLIAVVLLPVWSEAQQAFYKITVQLTDLKAPCKAYLVTAFGWTNQRVLDTVEVQNGAFFFKGKVDAPVKAHIVVDHAGKGLNNLGRAADALLVYLEEASMLVKGRDSVCRAVVSGSKLNTAFVQYHSEVLWPAEQAGVRADAAFRAAPERRDKAFIDSLQTTLKEAWKERETLKCNYIKQYPGSYFSLEALMEIAGESPDVSRIDPLFKSLSPVLRNSVAGKKFAALLYDKGPLAIGTYAPDFTQQDMSDHPVKLSDFKGKYVLLDFWASWCGPCRAENPAVLKAYNAYKNKKFTVLGVSLDQPGKKEAWLQAIAKDSLVWTQVSDLQYWNNAVAKQYGVRSIPQNFLLDPKGKIIAKNLRGEALHQKLKEVLGVLSPVPL
jgi:peroxiredoxin